MKEGICSVVVRQLWTTGSRIVHCCHHPLSEYFKRQKSKRNGTEIRDACQDGKMVEKRKLKLHIKLLVVGGWMVPPPHKVCLCPKLGFMMSSPFERGPWDAETILRYPGRPQTQNRCQRRRSEKTQARRQCDRRTESGVVQPQSGMLTTYRSWRGKQQPLPESPADNAVSYDNVWPRVVDQ